MPTVLGDLTHDGAGDLLDLFDIAESGQLSLAVPGEQMPLEGLAPNPKEEDHALHA